MDQSRFSTSPTPPTPPSPWQQPAARRSPSRQVSFVEMARPPLLRSPSMRDPENSLSTETIRPNRRKAVLEVEIPDAHSSSENVSRPTITRKASIKQTFDSLRRTKKPSRDPAHGLPELSCGESSQSEESAPSTPRTALSDSSCQSSVIDPEEEERKEREYREYFERQQTFRDLSQFEFRRQFIPHHRFPKEEVPYMQSYSHVALHNDYYTYDLLHYLTPSGSPTFYNFGNKPPRDVLDLGCGEGYWAVEAATVWKAAGTCVTAFDIVDLGRPLRNSLDPDLARQIIWVAGNFLQQKLPFPPKSFDLVRMANLTLAIPQDRWKHLLEEVKRILRPGGILEIVDDELFFPEIQSSPTTALARNRSLRERRNPDFDASVMHDQETGKGVWKPLPPCPPSRPAPLPRSASSYKQGSYSPLAGFELKSTTTRTMEAVFKNMLRDVYDISLSTHELLESTIAKIFGAVATETKRLVVPTKDLLIKNSKADDAASSLSREPVPRMSHRRRGRHSLDDAGTDVDPLMNIAPKAVRLLQPQACDPSLRARRPYQPSGFVVLPSTFIPCEPDILEMHACRNMHILLACKDALARFVRQHVDDTDEPFVSEEEFEELVFEYDTFKRQRMNWPQDYLGIKHEEEFLSPSKPMFSLGDLASRLRSQPMGIALNFPLPKDEAIPIRRIRAYIARKL